MFAHQVIDKIINRPNMYDHNSKILQGVVMGINNSQKFHFADLNQTVITTLKPNIEYDLFKNELLENIHPPFDICWFDFINTDFKHSLSNPFGSGIGYKELPQNEFDKYGSLLVLGTKDILHIVSFVHHPYMGWVAAPISIKINLLEKKDENIYSCSIENLFINKEKEAISELYLTVGKRLRSIILIYIQSALMLLNCKNIGTETVLAPVKLNNKRKKAGKQPIFSYHTLVIKPVGKKQESIPKHLWNNRIHLARGHFKTYTAEKPLFGKITGRFWWQPAVRGRNRDGVVMKDYEVKHA